MSTNVTVEENWVIEPELMEPTPRRTVSSEYPDLNRPNGTLMYGAGGLLILVGVAVLIIGLKGGNVLLDILGVVIALAGAAVVGFVGPELTRRHLDRNRHLCENGIPVMARILSAENMSGDYRFGRSVTYQIAMPDGDLIHKNTNADDRLLPKKIPANVTALMDINSKEVELYCAMPFRVVLKDGTVPPPRAVETPIDGVTPVTRTGTMGTIEMGEAPQPVKREKPEEKQPEAKPTKSGTAGLPWE